MMRFIFVFAMLLSIAFLFMKWRYRILNSMLNWKQGRKYLVPLLGNMILWKRKRKWFNF